MIDRAKRLLADLDAWSLRHRVPRITRRAMSGFMAHEGLQYAGSMAYFGVLSLFQFLVLGVVVGSFALGEGAARDFIIEQVEAGSPLEGDTVAGVIDAAIESRGSMSIISFGFLVWAGLGIFSALSRGIGRAFEMAPRRPFIKEKLVGLVLMALTGVLAVGSLAIGIVTGILQDAAAGVLAAVPGGGTAIWLIGLLLPLLLIFIAFWIIYKVVPNRPVRWGEVLPGAIVAALLWTVLRFGFTFYATEVVSYDSAFGPISTAITLLVFLYFASVIVLLGAEFSRASAVDDELGPITAANPRLLPVPVDQAPRPAAGIPGRPSRIRRWAFVAGAAVIGVVIGRASRRDDDDFD